jgi:hypothetical protein
MNWNWWKEVEGLNNRESAIAVWLLALLLFALLKKDTRRSVLGVVKSFFAWKIVTSYLLSIVYTCIGIYLLHRLHVWTLHQLKDAVLWCTISLMKTILQINQVNEKKDYFKDALKENLKFTLIIEFISETYTFSFLAEMFLISFLALLGMMLAFAGHDKKYTPLVAVLSRLLIFMGLATIFHALYEIVTHYGEFASADKLREFLLPPFLAIWFLPWLYVMSVVMRFETALIRFNLKRVKKPLYRLTRRTAIRHFLFDAEGLDRWTRDLQRHHINSPEDLRQSLDRLRNMREAEKNPPAIDPTLGWSPYAAKEFLKAEGITTRFYENLYEDQWGASSPYLKLEDDLMTNYITYSISGSQHIATELTLSLTIDNTRNENTGLHRFETCTRVLLKNAGITAAGKSISKIVRRKQNRETRIQHYKVGCRRHDYFNKTGQYTYTVTITALHQ